MFDFINISKALSDENRVRILMALRENELCVCQVTAFLDLAPSTSSKHLSILKQARLIESKKNGRWVYYTLAQNGSKIVKDALFWLMDNLSDCEEIIKDRERIQMVLELELTEPERCHSLEQHLLELELSKEGNHD